MNFDKFLDFKKYYKKLSNFDDFEPLGGPISQKIYKFLMFFDDLEFAPGSCQSSGSGVICYGSGPPFHTRRGSG
jgi:hypothetical protein